MSLRNDDDHGVGAIDDDILMLIPGTDLWINPSIMHMAPRTPPNPPARKVSGLFEVLNHMVRWGPKLPQNFHDTGLGIRLQQYNKDRALTALVEQQAAVDLMLPLSRRTPGFQILDRKLGGGGKQRHGDQLHQEEKPVHTLSQEEHQWTDQTTSKGHGNQRCDETEERSDRFTNQQVVDLRVAVSRPWTSNPFGWSYKYYPPTRKLTWQAAGKSPRSFLIGDTRTDSWWVFFFKPLTCLGILRV